MIHPAVFNTSEVCWSYGVRHAVFSPGSRNAPLIVSFSRNEKIKKWIIPDERSAGFIALGIAQKLNQPVVLCCTSGTALLNYAPAIAEAYYREIPLIVLSADRPPELIDQRDGQTIRQFEVLRNHVKDSIQLPLIEGTDDELSYTTKLSNSLSAIHELPQGPVHFNIPFKEPFYPDKGQTLHFNELKEQEYSNDDIGETHFPDAIDFEGRKILIIVGQCKPNPTLEESLKNVASSVPILVSPLSNLDLQSIQYFDLFIENQQELQPDILITTGLSVLSKKLKNFIRSQKPVKHYHFDPAGIEVDTFGTRPETIVAPLDRFLGKIELKPTTSYLNTWEKYSKKAVDSLEQFDSDSFSETSAIRTILKSLPGDIDLHLGNSMPVRFVEMFGIKPKTMTWCNRGTSGIDGCTSTAVGTAMVSNQTNVLLIGDVSFLYDRNAFFHNYNLRNLRVVVINNQGGGIFRLIDGPKRLPELEEYFETKHNRTAEYICLENNIEYTQVRNSEELASSITNFFDDSNNARLLEVFTDPATNEQVYKALKQHIHEQVNN